MSLINSKKIVFFLLSLGGLLITSCSEDVIEEKMPPPPSLNSVLFLVENNKMQLIDDVKCNIIGDSLVDCRIPHHSFDRRLVPVFDFVGDSLFVNGSLWGRQNLPIIDFSTPANVCVYSGYMRKIYTLYVTWFTGLPEVWIDTEGREEVNSKEKYVRGYFKMIDNEGEIIEDSLRIKGRGNSTWTMPKKPYRLKFDDKLSLLGGYKDKSWVLLANYSDKTMIHNKIAFYIGTMSNLDYTPKSHFVELFLNGRYDGTYELCEKIKISENRVNIGKEGFLIEADMGAESDPNSRCFKTPWKSLVFNIKDPEVEYNDEDFNYVKDYIINCERVLLGSSFSDPVNGWRKYMDEESFVEWYVINEITKNPDATFWNSCYMTIKRNEKLKMGPIWDFDLAFGNSSAIGGDPEGYRVRKGPWWNRLFHDSLFVSKVKERFLYYYSNKDMIIKEINFNAKNLKYAVEQNDNRWHTFYETTWPNYYVWGSYESEIYGMKEWLDRRFEWLKVEFEGL